VTVGTTRYHVEIPRLPPEDRIVVGAGTDESVSDSAEEADVEGSADLGKLRMLSGQDVSATRSPQHPQRSLDMAFVSIDIARKAEFVSKRDRIQLRGEREIDLVSLACRGRVEDDDPFTHRSLPAGSPASPAKSLGCGEPLKCCVHEFDGMECGQRSACPSQRAGDLNQTPRVGAGVRVWVDGEDPIGLVPTELGGSSGLDKVVDACATTTDLLISRINDSEFWNRSEHRPRLCANPLRVG
jgi:hypothetical protein